LSKHANEIDPRTVETYSLMIEFANTFKKFNYALKPVNCKTGVILQSLWLTVNSLCWGQSLYMQSFRNGSWFPLFT